MPPLDLDALKTELTERHGDHIDDKDVISAALYPKVFEDFENFRDSYGPVDKLDTKTFLLGPDIGQDIEVRRAKQAVSESPKQAHSAVKLFHCTESAILVRSRMCLHVCLSMNAPAAGGDRDWQGAGHPHARQV